MIIIEDREAIVRHLAEAPLRNVALLKHLFLYPRNTRAMMVAEGDRRATLVLLETEASAWDRATYGDCALVAFLASDAAELSAVLMEHVPLAGGAVFKLQSDAERAVLAARAGFEQTARYFSYTANGVFQRDPAVRITSRPGDGDFALISEQGHERATLEPQLASDDAFFCVLDDPGAPERPGAVCCVFRNHGPVFEIGGVVTRRDRRREGLARRVVATALAVLAERSRLPRYHVADGNVASIALAEGLGLQRFLTLTHHRTLSRGSPTNLHPGFVGAVA
ncbi:Acetyltransferase (GNAT) family protein [Kaistia soli DSM 19436]|uniref:Acetyltransferase (GNAT) family protein n=1 Tax=Kaistia soli DSM 19436 TaxID=1122133 RepID=A0A1M4W1D5_9HYPH|nr:GNAT family N-acetyltransferase [Kaistia soli]SHE74933.1 Acetyltransferase (GNAT) family protein [Kaistia soli DSM 19436]